MLFYAAGRKYSLAKDPAAPAGYAAGVARLFWLCVRHNPASPP